MGMIRVGTDIVVIDRVSSSIQKFGDRFLKRVFSESELENLSKKPESIAGYWASKEALSKALGCGIGSELSFLDMSISKDSKNAPYIELSQEKKERFRVDDISLSISHDGGFAIAVVVVVKLRGSNESNSKRGY